MEDSNILEIERLVLAQGEVKLTEDVKFINGDSFPYRIKAEANGRTLGEIIQPPRPTKLTVTTLTGFLDAIQAGVAGDIGHISTKHCRLIHVENHLTVSVKDTANDIYGARDTMLTAQCPAPDAFVFDQYYIDPAKFIIGLKVAFLQTDELLYLIRVASNLKAGNSVSAQDDGFSQTITLKAGEVSTAEVKIKPRIKLIPIRSFLELYFAEGGRAVESDFLIRFKQTPDQTPSIALFNVDGTRWQGEIMRSIKDYLAKNLPEGLPILA